MNAKKKKISVLTDTTASVQKEGEKKNASSDRQFSYTFNFIWRRSHFRWNRNRSVGTLRIYFFFFFVVDEVLLGSHIFSRRETQ